MNARAVQAAGLCTALGGLLWGLAWIVSPSRSGQNSQLEIWASAVFQAGLLALLAVMWVTAANGTSRLARAVLACEGVAVVLAIAWTVPYLFDANRPTTGILVVLDAFWPLSMAGLILVAAMVARVGRWPAPLRYLPLAASLLLPVDVALFWATESTRTAVMGAYLAVTYGLTGLAMLGQAERLPGIRHPALHVPREEARHGHAPH